MQDPYRYEILPLTTPDDDPRWKAFNDIFRQGFLDRRTSDAGMGIYRRCRRADGSTLGMVTAEGPGLDGRRPVGAFVSAPFTINDGAGIVPALCVNTIAVRPSHRRRGLLSTMMRAHLDAARADGIALAVLHASEATIYGRFGFAPGTTRATLRIDARRLVFRDDVEVAEGATEFVDPDFLVPHFDRLRDAHQRRYRGACGVQEQQRVGVLGEWDPAEDGRSRALRAVVHFDAEGVPDGFATFRHKGWDTEPVTTSVVQLCSADPAIDRALWRALASTDLVERLEYGLSHPADPLPLALVDPRGVSLHDVADGMWLRILDLPGAVAGRGFEADGTVVVRVADPMGYCDGTWEISVLGGRGTATRVAGEGEVVLDVGALARLWLGDRTAAALAQSGLVTGSGEGVARLSRILATAEAPVNLAEF